MKKLLNVLICFSFVFGLVFLFGCNSEEAGGSEDGGVTLDLWNNVASGRTFFPILIDRFEKENPGINIELTNVNVESSDAEYQAAVSDNNLPDMFITSSFSMNELVDLDLVHKLNEVFPEDVRKQYTDGVFDPGNTVIGDDIYLFPVFKGGTYMMYYNKDVLEKYGISDVPNTWAEMITVGKKIHEESGGETSGLIFGGKSGWLVNAITNLMAKELSPESGQSFITGKYNYATDGYIETIKFFKEMLDNNALSKMSLQTNSTTARELFAVGQAAFLIDGNWTGQLLYDVNDFKNYGVVPLPTKNEDGQVYGSFGLGSGDGMYVAKNTEHWEEVKKFLIFLRENMYKELVKVGEATIAKKFDVVDAEAPFPQIKEIQQIFKETSIQVPSPVVVNPETLQVELEVGKNAPDGDPGKILMGYLTGQVTNLEKTLQEFTDEYNKALQDALEANDAVSIEDYQFPNWEPYQPYTQADYEELNN